MLRRGVLTAAGLVALALPASASAQGVLDANCPGPRDGTSTHPPPERFAQMFVAQTSGALTAAQFEGTRSPGGGGDYVFDINETDASGVPTNTTLATASVPTAALPEGDFTASATFANPAQVTSGQRYALVLRRLVGNLTIARRIGDVCPAGSLFDSPSGTGPFAPEPAGFDMIFAVFVEPTPPDTALPETAITGGPKAKTKKKQATFEFSGTDGRAVAGFECSLDGGAFATCTSPHTVKVKKGKHTFSVRATDQAGNVDAAPATFDWKVKKRR